ncbi:MAG: 4-coumarate--CoA ligase family protein [Acidimicrobiia bacterium]|nr:4-coumarate--CoA ligase family protein [Acidimicrobiia bacterium]MYE72305.1 4-coumarate--CoA ligase family protein [Acidimicrobiia bacterium]MYJ62477.1 4-coumarate--CoA ligase family protein [Acidimicrobiia bacterium]
MVHPSPLPDEPLSSQPVTGFVLERAGKLADKEALIDGPGEWSLTYGQLEQSVFSLAGGLAARGFQRGDVAALIALNSPWYPVVFHAVAVAGGAVTTVNPTYGAEEIAYQLTDSQATLVFAADMFATQTREAMNRAGIAGDVVVIDSDNPSEGVAMQSLMGDPITQVEVDPHNDVVVLPYSSGTTGLPKGVMLTHANLVNNIEQCVSSVASQTSDVVLAVLPFFHIYGMQVLMNDQLHHGAKLVTMPRFDLAQALSLIERHQVTRFFAVPPIVLALAKHPAVADFDLSSLRQVLSGAAPLGAEVAEEASARIGCEVVQGYGMTELSPISHATPPGNYKPGSVGLTVANTEARIVAPDSGEDLPAGPEGELWIRGPQVMKGYLNNPDATAETIDHDGWLHTGDIARIDDDGHVYVVDRLKELIKVKGFQVAPAELEALLLDHPQITDAAVVGRPDDESGEVPLAFVVVGPDTRIEEQAVKDYVADHVATYKHLGEVRFADAIPKSASGKILRRELRELVDG